MNKLRQIALSMLPGLGATGCRRLLKAMPGVDPFELPHDELQRLFHSNRDTCAAIAGRTTFEQAGRCLRWAEEKGVRVLFCTDDDFPQRLCRPDTPDAPVLLYALGRADLNAARTLALVGSRKATHHGREFTARLVAGLKPCGATVVSGLAYGIDTAAHTAALDEGLPTVAVLGHGLDRIYPPENRALARRIVEQGGALVTEYPHGTAINPRHFPARNRIIAALSDAVGVVEAQRKGGALITASIAQSYHREVFAVPGRPSDPCSEGTNALIATQRASMARSADDIAAIMDWPLGETQAAQPTLFPTLTAEQQHLYDVLAGEESTSMDSLLEQCGLPRPAVMAALFDLEAMQMVQALPGRRYRATTNSRQ